MQNVLPHAQRLITNFISACLADNRDANGDQEIENEKEDVKLHGQVDVSEVHRIIKTEPAKHKDETDIQRKVLEAAETAMESTDFDLIAPMSGECKVALKDHMITITREIKNKDTGRRTQCSETFVGSNSTI